MRKIFLFGIVFLLLISSVSASLDTDLYACWDMNDAPTTMEDLTGNGHNLTKQNTVTSPNAIYDTGIKTTGGTGTIKGYRASECYSDLWGVSDFTLCGIFALNSTTQNAGAVVVSDASTSRTWELYYQDSSNQGYTVRVCDSGGSCVANDFYQPSDEDAGFMGICLTWNESASTMKFYYNDVLRKTYTGTDMATCAQKDNDLLFLTLWPDNDPRTLDGIWDDTALWDRVLTSSELTEWYNSGSYTSCSGIIGTPAGANSSLTVTALDLYDSASLSGFNITLYNATHSWTNTTTGSSAIINLPNNQTKTYTLMVSKSNYFNYTTSLNVGIGESHEAKLYQARICFNASEIKSGNAITSFNFTETYQNNVSNASGVACGYFTSGWKTVTVSSSGYLDASEGFTVTALQNETINLEFPTARITVYAKEIFTNNSIAEFTTVLQDLTYGSANDTVMTVSNQTYHDVINGTYKIHIDATDYAIEDYTINIGNLTEYNYTFYLYSDNSITIRTYYADNYTLMVGPDIDYDVTYLVTNTTLYYSSTNGSLYLDNQTAGNYLVRIESDGFIPSEYYYTLLARNHIFLDTYLTSTDDLKYFYIRDLSNTLIEGALLTVTQNINSSWVTIAQRYTDITGSAYFGLDDFTEYRILITAPNYETKQISLTPVLDSYTIYLTANSSISFETAYDDLSYYILPSGTILSDLYNNVSFNLTTSSPSGLIEYFGLSASYNGTPYLDNVTGSVNGGTAVIDLPLLNASGILDVNFWIKIENEDLLDFTITYYLQDIDAGNYSLQEIGTAYQNEFSEIEKVLIATGTAIFLMVVCFALGFPPASLGFVGTLPYIIFSSIGFLEWWITIITVVFSLTLYLFMKD